MNMAARLNQGFDVAGQPLGTATRFHLGAAVNPFAADPDAEWRRLAYKVDAGAEFLMTPPVLDVDAFEPALRRIEDTGLPVLVGVAALQSVRHAEFLASEVIGVRVADELLARLRGAGDEEREAGVVTAEIASWLKARAQGVVITWLHGSTATAERLLPAVGLSAPTSAGQQGSAA
jgi:homocysteine S-methyltransferase